MTGLVQVTMCDVTNIDGEIHNLCNAEETDALKSENRQLKLKISDLERKLKETEKELKEARHAVERKERYIRDLEQQVASLRDKIKKLEKDTKEDKDNIMTRMDELEYSLNMHKSESSEMFAAIQNQIDDNDERKPETYGGDAGAELLVIEDTNTSQVYNILKFAKRNSIHRRAIKGAGGDVVILAVVHGETVQAATRATSTLLGRHAGRPVNVLWINDGRKVENLEAQFKKNLRNTMDKISHINQFSSSELNLDCIDKCIEDFYP